MKKPFLVVNVKISENGHFCRRVLLVEDRENLRELERTSNTSLALEGDLYKKNRRTVLLLSGATKARYSCLESSDSRSLLKGRLVLE